MPKKKDAPATPEPKATVEPANPWQELPERPFWLIGSLAEKQWDKLVKDILAVRLLHPSDGEQIAIACGFFEEYLHARLEVKNTGRTFIARSGYPCPRPAVKQIEISLTKYQNAIGKLGLNATARKGMKQNSYGVKAAVLSRGPGKGRV